MKSYKASHILVPAKYEALDILRKLTATPNEFESFARRYSICSSAPQGGYLGEIQIGKADSDFEESVLDLKINEISKIPVRTKFGYHIIKRNG
jgi:peptidyl-prolyl cis-trans isomerase C